MKRELVVILLACISMLCFSCKKFSNGDLDTDVRHIGSFQVIEMNDNVDVVLKHCDAEHEAGEVIIETGKNLLDDIITDTDSVLIKTNDENKKKLNKLVIGNRNTLNFLRPYDYKLKATVYYDSLYMLYFNTNGTIVTDTLHGYLWPRKTQTDSGVLQHEIAALWLEVQSGSGDIYIKTNCAYLTTKYTQGTACITIGGKVSNYANTYSNYDCHGIIDEIELESRNHSINYYGTNKVYVKVVDRLSAVNNNLGYIYYKRFKKTESIYDEELGYHIDSVFTCPQHMYFDGAYKDNIKLYKPN